MMGGKLDVFFSVYVVWLMLLRFYPLELGHQHLQVDAIQSGVFIIILHAVGVFTVFLIFNSHNQRTVL